MEEAEYNKTKDTIEVVEKTEEKTVEETSNDTQTTSEEKLDPNEDLFSKLRSIRTPLDGEPAFTPQGLIDQFQFFDNQLFAFIANKWSSIGSRFAVGNATLSATGDLSVGGIGFKPKFIIVFAASGEIGSGFSIAGCDGDDCVGLIRYYHTGYSNWHNNIISTGMIIRVIDAVDNANETRAYIKSFDDSGFTIECTNADLTTSFGYIAIG